LPHTTPGIYNVFQTNDNSSAHNGLVDDMLVDNTASGVSPPFLTPPPDNTPQESTTVFSPDPINNNNVDVAAPPPPCDPTTSTTSIHLPNTPNLQCTLGVFIDKIQTDLASDDPTPTTPLSWMPLTAAVAAFGNEMAATKEQMQQSHCNLEGNLNLAPPWSQKMN
jgi:hypothetical protein